MTKKPKRPGNGTPVRKPSKRTPKRVPRADTEIRTEALECLEKLQQRHQLTLAEVIFVQEYIVTLNATEAYRRAFDPVPRNGNGGTGRHYKSNMVNYNALGVEAHKLMQEPRIQAAIRQALNDRVQRLQVNQDNVIVELARLAFSDITKIASWDGLGNVAYLPSEGLPKEVAASIAAIEETTTTFAVQGRKDEEKTVRKLKIKLHPKQAALDTLAKHLGILVERFQIGELPADLLAKSPEQMTLEEKLETLRKLRQHRLQVINGGKK